jgi:Ca2+-binding RTX toxin-like protein
MAIVHGNSDATASPYSCDCCDCCNWTEQGAGGTSESSATSPFSGYKWGGSSLGSAGGVVTWSFATLAGQHYSFTSAISQTAYRDLITAAFAFWESVANIDFQYQANDTAGTDIRLGWDTIDGVHGTVGQAVTYYMPTSGYDQNQFSEIRFDQAEDWSVNNTTDPNGTDFYAVAIHEIGHTLGLEHSALTSSVMYPSVGAHQPSAGDISNIQQLYGAPTVALIPTEDADTLSASSAGNIINALGGDDSVHGNGGNDTIHGNNDGDTLYGDAGDDILYGDAGLDTLYGGDGLDQLWGGDSNDVLDGGIGKDRLYGEAGADTMIGGGSKDWLTGGDGNDSVNGGGGSDIFIFRAGDDADTFTHFINGYDKMDLTAMNLSFTQVRALAHQSGADVVIDFGGGDSITIDNFTMAKLTSSDFIL